MSVVLKPKVKKSEDEVKVHDKVFKAFSFERIKEGWTFVTITFQGGVVTDVHYSEPDLKSIILEKFKIAVAKYWSTLG